MENYVSSRLRYFNGQFLEVADFNDEQNYHLNRRLLHNKHLHTAGIIEGFAIVREDYNKIIARAGLALDSLGRELILRDDVSLDCKGSKGSPCCVWIEYSEEPKDYQNKPDAETATRVEEKVTLYVAPDFPAKTEKAYVKLARFTLTDKGLIPDIKGDLDGVSGISNTKVQSEKVFVGAKLANRSVSVSQLRTELRASSDSASIKIGNSHTAKVGETLLRDNKSSHLLVFASINKFVDKASFSWEIINSCSKDANSVEYHTQEVIFKTNSNVEFSISYKIYALLE
jgi:hypothetical protein